MFDFYWFYRFSHLVVFLTLLARPDDTSRWSQQTDVLAT